MTRDLLTIDSLECRRGVISAAIDHFEQHPRLSFEDCLMAEQASASSALPLHTFDVKLTRQRRHATGRSSALCRLEDDRAKSRGHLDGIEFEGAVANVQLDHDPARIPCRAPGARRAAQPLVDGHVWTSRWLRSGRATRGLPARSQWTLRADCWAMMPLGK